MGGREALVACCEKKMSGGISIWDLECGEQLIHIPTCASPPHGLLSLSNNFLVASQVQKHGSFGGGAIFIWPLNKPQAPPHRSYPIEAIGPISCTKDGLFLVGGAPSGNAYIWEVSSGRLLKNWCAHHRSLNCLSFSNDDSLIISGAEDGVICVWSMISVLDMADSQPCGSLPPFHSWSDHESSITGLLSTFGGSSSVLISSSLDGTCKVWDPIQGRLLQSSAFPSAVTAIVLDPGEQLLFSGMEDGRILANALDIGLQENPTIISEDQSMVLSGHKGSITSLALSISGLWLISASEDCTACVWDVSSWQITRRMFNHGIGIITSVQVARKIPLLRYVKVKEVFTGHITNLLVIPQSSLFSMTEGQSNSIRFRIPLLEKAPQLASALEGTIALLPTYCSKEDHFVSNGFLSSDSMNHQIQDLEQGRTPEAIQMKVETSVANRVWATSMTKHVTTMNKHLRVQLLDMMECRLCIDSEIASEKRKKHKADDPEERPKSPPEDLGH